MAVKYVTIIVFGLFVIMKSEAKLSGFAGIANMSSSRVHSTTSQVECRDYHKLHNSSEWCTFVNTTENCQMDEGFVDYIQVAFCNYDPKYLPAIAILYALWLIFLFIGLGTAAEGFFCPSLEFIAHNLKLSQNIAGLTIVAFGNGAPDIFSALAAFTNSNSTTTGVAIGALLGAAMLLTTTVSGLVSCSTEEFTIAQRPFIRDMVFFIGSVFWTFCILYSGEITLFNTVGFLVLYVFYVAVVVIGRYIHQRQRASRARALDEDSSEDRVVAAAGATPVNSSEVSDERSPLLSSAGGTPVRNTNNNNADRDSEWSDVRLRTSSYENSREAKFDSSVETGTDLPKADQDVEEFFDEVAHAGKSTLYIFWFGMNPVRKRSWRKVGFMMKVLMIAQAPWKLFCNLTIPIVGVVESRNGTDPSRWNRPLYCFSLLVSPTLCVFATKGGDVMIGGVFPLWALLLIIGAFFAALVWFTTSNQHRPVYQWVFAYIGFVVAIVLTYTIANEIVNLIQTFGILLNVTNVIMGLTFLAWGNSIGDVVSDVALAKQGYPRMSMSACYGGPLFNLLIGLGLPCTITNIRRGSNNPIQVKFTSVEAVICGGLLFSLCVSFVVIPLRKFRITRGYGVILISIYVVFLIVAILAGVNVF